jgi:hypothetical protein
LTKIITLIFCIISLAASGQVTTDSTLLPGADSVMVNDTAAQKNDSLVRTVGFIDTVSKNPRKNSGWTIRTDSINDLRQLGWEIMYRNPYFDFKSKAAIPAVSAQRIIKGKEILFYLFVFLFIVFALLRMAFPKYFSDLFRLFFRTTLNQSQVREQLIQTPLPSLILNGFFVVSAGLYISFLLQHYSVIKPGEFWKMFLLATIGLSAAYFVKYIGLKISGWLFQVNSVADAYIFVVFIINKMLGILLLPFLVILAFAVGDVYKVGLTLSLCLLGGMLLYRLVLSFGAIRNQVRVNIFHFFLYICAFEIAPLLLVYKGLLLYFGLSA